MANSLQLMVEMVAPTKAHNAGGITSGHGGLVPLRHRSIDDDFLSGALNLGLVVRWQYESENGAARLMRIHPHSSRMGVHDGTTD
jgi:hypothetical protein